MFLKNHWYAAAFSDEIKQEILARTILDNELVMYRTADGAPVVLEDRCAHRDLPLSMGKLVGDDLQCGYHGLVYDQCGRCIRVPGQKSVPPSARVRSFPSVERHGFIWVWTGDAEAADPDLLPDYAMVDDTRLLRTKFHVLLNCNYQLHIDNLLDLSHIAYVHDTTTGNRDIGEKTDITTERIGNTVHVIRRQSAVAPPETFRQFGGFTGLVDMWQVTEFNPPTYVHLSYGSAATGVMDVADRDIWSHGEWGFEVFQGVTPETERTSHQMRYIVVEPGNVDAAAFAELCRQFDQISMEDAPVLARQQAALERGATGGVHDFLSRAPIEADHGLILARKINAEFLRAEIAAGGRKNADSAAAE
jgi:vanillate monooxygenase